MEQLKCQTTSLDLQLIGNKTSLIEVWVWKKTFKGKRNNLKRALFYLSDGSLHSPTIIIVT